MRFQRHAIAALSCLCLAACSSGKTIEDYSALEPSREITGSVVANAPTPEVEVGAAAAAAGGVAAVIAADEKSSPTASYVEPSEVEPAVEAVAMVAAPKPSLRPRIEQAPGRAIDKAARVVAPNVVRHRFRDAHPINFGKAAPQKLAVHGVDVSRWQGDIDWVKLRSQGANFVYIKATDGGDHLDPMFRKNWRDADRAGLKRGAYHFFYWCRVASEQADWFIRNVPKVPGALPPVIDVEWNGQSRCKKRPSRATVLEKMQVFMDKLEAHYGQRPVIYTAPDFYDDNLKGAFKNYPFWLRSVAAHPSKRYPGRDWVFWQYSGSGLSHGVDGRIDLNVFHGGEGEWRRWVARNAG